MRVNDWVILQLRKEEAQNDQWSHSRRKFSFEMPPYNRIFHMTNNFQNEYFIVDYFLYRCCDSLRNILSIVLLTVKQEQPLELPRNYNWDWAVFLSYITLHGNFLDHRHLKSRIDFDFPSFMKDSRCYDEGLLLCNAFRHSKQDTESFFCLSQFLLHFLLRFQLILLLLM